MADKKKKTEISKEWLKIPSDLAPYVSPHALSIYESMFGAKKGSLTAAINENKDVLIQFVPKDGSTKEMVSAVVPRSTAKTIMFGATYGYVFDAQSAVGLSVGLSHVSMSASTPPTFEEQIQEAQSTLAKLKTTASKVSFKDGGEFLKNQQEIKSLEGKIKNLKAMIANKKIGDAVAKNAATEAWSETAKKVYDSIYKPPSGLKSLPPLPLEPLNSPEAMALYPVPKSKYDLLEETVIMDWAKAVQQSQNKAKASLTEQIEKIQDLIAAQTFDAPKPAVKGSVTWDSGPVIYGEPGYHKSSYDAPKLFTQQVMGVFNAPKEFDQHRLFELQKETLFWKKTASVADWPIIKPNIWEFLDKHLPPCCTRSDPAELEFYESINHYFNMVRVEHFVEKHQGKGEAQYLSRIDEVIGLISDLWNSRDLLATEHAASILQSQLPPSAPVIPATAFETYAGANELCKQLTKWFQSGGASIDDAPVLFEVTLHGLTEEEVNTLLKNYTKNTKKPVLVHKTARKELGTNSKPIVIWPFESSSLQVNGEPILYKTQLNEDGTLSCNCMGWTMGSAKSSGGRFCKHTSAVKTDAELLYKKWKKGEALGENFEVVSQAAVSTATSKTLFKALKEKPGVGEATMFTAKRVVEI